MELKYGNSTPTSAYRHGSEVELFSACSTSVAAAATPTNYLNGATGYNIPNLSMASTGKEVVIESIEVVEGGAGAKGVFRVYKATTLGDATQMWACAISGGFGKRDAAVPPTGFPTHLSSGHLRIACTAGGFSYCITGYLRKFLAKSTQY